MKKPTALFLAMMGFIVLVAQGFRTSARPPGPSSSDDGYVMGQDFTSLLANPNVTLKIEEGEDTVYFAWSSTNKARLGEVRRLGEHMQSVKRALEMRIDDGDFPDPGVKTAARGN